MLMKINSFRNVCVALTYEIIYVIKFPLNIQTKMFSFNFECSMAQILFATAQAQLTVQQTS